MPSQRDLVKRRASRRAYYWRHREKIRAEQNAYGNTPEHRVAAIARAKKHYEKVRGTARTKFIHQLKPQAKSRGLVLEITLEQYELIIAGGRCSYCGDSLPVDGHGLDRIDNQFGYTIENVTPCCTRCNIRKGLLEKIGFKYPRTVELLKELIELND